jgi:gliding motility-associated-like protein
MSRARPAPYFITLSTVLLFAALFLPGRTAGQVSCTPVFINEFRGVGGSPVEVHAVKALADGSTLVAGRAAATGASTFDGYIARHNADGTSQWSFFVGGVADDELNGIAPLSDGSFLLYGTTSSYGHPEGKGWLVRIDLTGTVLWSGQIGASGISTDRVKALQQYSDGDIIGTLNVNDSSAASNPVVFKLGLDGTLRWSSTFDNGGDDSFTSLAVSGDTVYAGGYATQASAQLGVLTELQAETGTQLISTNVSYGAATVRSQVTSLQIYNGVISYGLYVTNGVSPSNNGINGLLLVRTDLSGHTQLATYVHDDASAGLLKAVRTSDTGFYVLNIGDGSFGFSAVNKIDRYGYVSWGFYLEPTVNDATFPALDVTGDNGCVLGGHYFTFLNSLFTVERLIRLTSRGEAGSCDLTGAPFYALPDIYSQSSFTWHIFSPSALQSQAVPPPSSPDALEPVSSCSSSVCLNQTTIPAGCLKTYNIQYLSANRSLFEDAVTMPDGGRVAVGQLGQTEGLVVRFQSNGSIAWSKNYNLPGGDVVNSSQVMQFRRIMQMNDGNLLVIGNEYYTQNHYAYREMVLLKIDPNGNVIWCHFVMMGDTEVADAAITPDNGFVVCFNDGYGGGGSSVWAARYDANANELWHKLVTHGNFSAVYKSIACSQDAVFIASDAYLYAYDEFSVDRLDLATGNLVYSSLLSAGANVSVRINRVLTIHDSAYVFLDQFPDNITPTCTTVFFALDQQGSVMRALNLGNDQLNVNIPWTQLSYLDGCPSTVGLTPDLDFWLATRVVQNGIDYFAITRLKPDGTVELAKLHTGINGYLPLGVRSQGKGVVVVGANPAPKTGDVDFFSPFVLKLDSSGQLQPGVAGTCVAADRSFPVSPITSWKTGTYYYNPPTSTNTYPLTNTTASPYNEDNDLLAELFCYLPANCNSVMLQQKGAACATNDTLVYYLDNSANCGAAATWSYDTGFFKPGLIAGDSIQLIALNAGTTSVGAKIEGYCSMTNQSKPATMVFGGPGGLKLPADTVICSNGPIQLEATPGYSSYLWSDNSNGVNLMVSKAGVYSVSATDGCGHTVNASVTVTDANASFKVTPDTLKCNNDVDTLRATGGYTNYQWTPDYVAVQGNTALVSPAVTTIYTVMATRSQGCTVQASTLVTALSSPPVLLGNDTSLCKGDSLLLDGGPGFGSYQWSTGARTERIYVQQPGLYLLSALFPNGCTSRDSLRVLNLYDPQPNLNKNPVVCAGEPRILNAGSGFVSYLWNDGSLGSTLSIDAKGEYWVRVTDQHGCIAGDTVVIVAVAGLPSDFLPTDTSICQYGDLVLKISGSYDSYTWNDLSAASSLTVGQEGTYWAQVTDGNGCTATDTVHVTKRNCLVGIFVPNAFTPNGDGKNDRLRPLLYGNYLLVDFAVFGRWGQRVFETQTPLDGWDGTINGTPAPAGTYVWYCRYRIDGSPEAQEKGTVILIR